MHSRIHEEDVVGDRKVKRHASGLEADEEHLYSGIGLKRLENLKTNVQFFMRRFSEY